MESKKKINVLVIIQARMASSRLPGKILMKLEGIPLIQHTIMRARKASNVDEVVLATSDTKADDAVEGLCRRIGANCFRGSEEDVLSRFIGAAEKFKPKLIVRICGDEPLLDEKILEQAIQKHIEAGVDYSTTVGCVPTGMDVEIVDYPLLKQTEKQAKDQYYREHVTSFIWTNPKKFKIQRLDFGKKLARPDIVLTVDTKEDFDFVEKLYFELKKTGELYSGNLAEKIIKLIDSKKVKRKPILLLRADGSKQKGMGDLVSLMNIAEPLRDEYECIFASKNYPDAVEFIKSKGYEVFCLPLNSEKEKEIKQIRDFCYIRNIKYCSVFLYPNDANYVKQLSTFLKTLMVDFHGDIDVYSDILLYWDLFAPDLKYNFVNNNTLKLLGPDYSPLKKGIIKYAKMSNHEELKNILITTGGSDPKDLSFNLLDLVLGKRLYQKHNFTFVIGPSFGRLKDFKNKVKNNEVKIVFSPDNIYELYSKNDLVISRGGLTSFELAALGIPFIGTSELSWEIKRLKKMQALGVCRFVPLNDKLNDNILKLIKKLFDLSTRNEMTQKGRKLVDGKGASRIANIIKSRWKE